MRICRKVFDEIINIVLETPQEVGGIIGGYRDVFKNHYLDIGVKANGTCNYTPNVSVLNTISRLVEE